eukprot:gnl/TRDRNA2_/TRDRNA2_44758_c0_seq1.p1 gnl/TRDRNA2_/TRDRNA2_44758_c0~~gnl/TRDRNA2_/TRDRNA2_44758_c0_seq1.p1  ORF type:complete len:382 (-),score=15.62 gnl/TRDRNA2_/TRDRNA2_44758_c0_seq1:140-1285(-)
MFHVPRVCACVFVYATSWCLPCTFAFRIRKSPNATAFGSAPFHHCKLKVCNFHDAGRPSIYAHSHQGGSGYKLMRLISLMAIAKRFDMNVGGYLTTWWEQWPRRGYVNLMRTGHLGDNFDEIVCDLFGPQYKDVFVPLAVPEPFWDTIVDRRSGLLANRSHIKDSAQIYVAGMEPWWDPDDLDPELLSELRRPILLRSLSLVTEHPMVAIHLRRGDEPNRQHGVPDSLYYHLVDRIKNHLPTAEIHVFSSLEKNRDGVRYWKSSDFDGFRQKGMHVHFDEVGTADTWAYFARAAVMITAASTFSTASAVLNPNCVICIAFCGKIPFAMEGGEKQRISYDAELKDCIDRKLYLKWQSGSEWLPLRKQYKVDFHQDTSAASVL